MVNKSKLVIEKVKILDRLIIITYYNSSVMAVKLLVLTESIHTVDKCIYC